MSVQPAPALVGREPELERLRAAIEEASAGRLAACVVEGEAGIGKTALLDRVIGHARAAGAALLRAGSTELTMDRPFGPLLDALGLGVEEIADVGEREGPIELPTSMTPDVRYRAIETLVERLEKATASGPAVLAVDDLQWADAGTIVALRRIVQELRESPLAVLVAVRPIPRPEHLAILLDDLEREGATRIVLAPLAPEDLVALAEATLARVPGANLRTMLARAGGNPFIAHEILAAAVTEGLVEAGDTADTSGPDVPEEVRLVVLQRISRSPPEVRELLRQASILGTSFSATDLASFLRRPATELEPIIERAVRSGDLVASDDALRFRHDIVRDAVYEDMPPAVRAALHLEAGRALTAAGAPATSAATHFSIGARPGDREAADTIRRAAREAIAADPPTAVSLLERAIDLETDPQGSDSIGRELLSALLWAGRLDEAMALGERLIGRGDQGTDAIIRIALGTALEAQARWDDARVQFAAVAEGRLPAPDRALLLAHRAHLALPGGDLAGAAAQASEARRLAEDRPSLALSIALHVQILLADVAGRWTEVPGLIREVERSQDADPSEEARLWPARGLAVFLCRAGDVDEADAVIRRGVALAEETGLPLVLHTMLAALAWKELYAGHLDEARAHAETALRIGRQTQALSAIVLSLSILARVALHRGELDEAQEVLDKVIAEMSRHPLQYQAQMAMWGRALLAEARGDAAEAHDAMASALDLVIALGWEGEVLDPAADAVRIMLAAGDRTRAETITAIVERLADREGLPTLRGAALQCRGLVEGDASLLRDAAAGWGGTGRVLDLARAREDAGRAMADADRTDEARSLLAEAAGAFGAAGATRDQARCEKGLRELGVRRGARGTRDRPETGPEALTDAERRVVELAADGLTNPEIAERLFVSRHTVKTHLAHAFQKLGVGSRLELVRMLAARRV